MGKFVFSSGDVLRVLEFCWVLSSGDVLRVWDDPGPYLGRSSLQSWRLLSTFWHSGRPSSRPGTFNLSQSSVVDPEQDPDPGRIRN